MENSAFNIVFLDSSFRLRHILNEVKDLMNNNSTTRCNAIHASGGEQFMRGTRNSRECTRAFHFNHRGQVCVERKKSGELTSSPLCDILNKKLIYFA